MVEHKKLLNEQETALYLGLSRSTLRQGRMNGYRTGRCPVPPYLRLGRKIVYLKDDLDRFLEARRVNGKGGVMGKNQLWVGVSKRLPCQRCGGVTGCFRSMNGIWVICSRQSRTMERKVVKESSGIWGPLAVYCLINKNRHWNLPNSKSTDHLSLFECSLEGVIEVQN